MSAAGYSRAGWLALVPLAGFAAAVWLHLSGALPLRVEIPWVPALGIDLALLVDGWSLIFWLLITGIGAFVFVYAGGYMAGEPKRERLFVLLLAFLVAMLGCVTADNLIALFVFWELTGLTSFLLVGFKHADPGARRSAQQALMVTGGGGLVLFVGLILLGEIGGSYSIAELMRTSAAWIDDPRVPVALCCIFVGAFAKSAQFPFHFWLPNAMSAPTPVSAWLHSATMVKLGVYLLGRLHPAFWDHPLWQVSLIGVGGFTAAYAMLLTLRERDLKRILAWSTVSALGTLVMLIGIPGDGAATATVAFLLAHALYKAPLFFVAGNVDYATGTRRIDDLAQLGRAMPFTAAAALLAAVSMAGMPLSFGFVAKDLISIAKEEGGAYAWVGWASVLVSAISVAVAAVAALRVFWLRGARGSCAGIREGGPALWGPPLGLAALGIVFGPLPHLLEPLIVGGAAAMQPALDYRGLSFALADPSALGPLFVALGLGVAFFLAWDRLHRGLERLAWVNRYGPESWYGWMLRGIPTAAAALTTRLQGGSLPGYVALLLGFVGGTLLAALWVAVPAEWPGWVPPSAGLTGAVLLLLTGAAAVCVVRDPFVLLLSTGLVGLGSAFVFLFLGAPDLALTQFAVEVAFVVVIAAVLLRVRRLGLAPAPTAASLPRALLALGNGGLVAVLMLLAAGGPFDPGLHEYFGATAVPEAHGRNVVNVILVDFRAVDTLGEIAVVAASFLGALPLLLLVRARRRRRETPR